MRRNQPQDLICPFVLSLSKDLFWRALMGCLLVLLSFTSFAAAPAGSWWDTTFPYRYPITIPAGTSTLDAGYAVSITFDHAAAVTAGTSLASGDDVRIVRWTGSAWAELDRVANAPDTWNTTSTRVWFKTASAIASGGSDDNYYLYYGKTTSPGTPLSNGETVFTHLHDEFTGTTLSTTRWDLSGSGNATVSGGTLSLSPGRILESDSSWGVATIWEARISMPESLPGGSSAAFYFWLASSSSSYTGSHAGFTADVDDHYITTRSIGLNETPINAGTPTGFQVYSFTRESFLGILRSSSFRINGSDVGTFSELILPINVPTVDLPVLVRNSANGGRTQVYDWVRVRPYRNPEPVPTRGSLEPLSTGPNHFVVAHDGYGINCVTETITVSPRDSSNAVLTTYSQEITLTTNTGKGTWTRLTGTGTFTDATANDGLATYQWVSGETSASFALYYPEGTQNFDVDAYQTSNTTIRDDDTEGFLSFAPSGFTVTTSALVNGTNPITVPSPFANQIAGTAFSTHIAAYGQTPTDPTCGIIEAYTGSKSLKFWTGYTNPATGTVRFTVNGTTSAATEGAAAAQNVTFTNGQATVSVKYKDVGSVTLNLKDDTTGNPSLPTGIRGSGATIVKPASFALTQIRRQSDNFANPAAANASGAAFMTSGDNFAATVTVYDAEGSITPNYGKETPAESVALTANLVAPAGGNNPAIAASPGFGAFNNGVATGTGFSWSEVGIITLTPRIGDGNYLGAGDITGATSGNVGRFIPANFAVSLTTTPLLQTGCAAGGFSYVGEPLAYTTAPVLTVTAQSASGTTTQNYAGTFVKLTSTAGQTTYTSSAGTPALLGTANAPASTSPSNGQWQLTYGSSLGVEYDHTTPVAPFTPQLTLNLTLLDSDNVTTSPAPYTLTMTAAPHRYGRIAFRNAVGSELIDLAVPLRAEFYFNDAQGFITNTSDVCTTGITMSFGAYGGSLNAGETCVQDTGSPGVSGAGCTTAAAISRRFTVPPNLGNFNLWLRAPGSGNQGTVTLTPTVPAWLRYDWNPAVAGQENPTGIATFGIYQGSPKRLYTRERY